MWNAYADLGTWYGLTPLRRRGPRRRLQPRLGRHRHRLRQLRQQHDRRLPVLRHRRLFQRRQPRRSRLVADGRPGLQDHAQPEAGARLPLPRLRQVHHGRRQLRRRRQRRRRGLPGLLLQARVEGADLERRPHRPALLSRRGPGRRRKGRSCANTDRRRFGFKNGALRGAVFVWRGCAQVAPAAKAAGFRRRL